MDKVILKEMRFVGRHGALLEERVQGQEFVVDVELEADLAAAGRADALEQTVDYRRAYEVVREIVEGEPRTLLETVAEQIAARLLALDGVRAATVRVRKPQVRLPGPLAYAAVEIRREKR